MKTLGTSVRIALRALKVNRTRSALTMLGIIIGVAAVIAMVGVGSGATERIQEQIQSIGSNLIIVLPGSVSNNGVRLGSGGVATLTQDDAKALATECPSVVLAAPTVRGGVQVVYGNNNWATTVQGVTPDYMTLRDYTMLSGQFFTAQESRPPPRPRCWEKPSRRISSATVTPRVKWSSSRTCRSPSAAC